MHQQTYSLSQMVILSTICHLLFYLAAIKLNFSFLSGIKEEPVYYVDVVNLPVADPQAGSPVLAGSATALPTPIERQEMKLPAKTPAKTTLPKKLPHPVPQAGKTTGTAETAREFEERINRIQKETEARHQAAALESLRKKSTAGTGAGVPGMPGATGKEAGSDYANYIQSRLRDAFAATITYQSKNPEVLVRLTLNKKGRLIRYRLEKSSGDKVFEDAVILAITNAEKSFPPPPNNKDFEHGFVFRPQGVGKN